MGYVWDRPIRHRDLIERELESGERIVWAGMPVPRLFTPGAAAAFLFGIPWTAFSIFWTAGAAWGTIDAADGDKMPGFFVCFPLFGVPFILIGLGMLSSPWWAYRKALNTVYVITDRRAISFDGGWSTTIRSYPPDTLQNIYRREHRNGTGDVIFRDRRWRDSDGDQRSEQLGFLQVRSPKEVEQRIKQLAKAASSGKEGN